MIIVTKDNFQSEVENSDKLVVEKCTKHAVAVFQCSVN